VNVEVNTLCIIGAGTMGTGIAQVAAQAGLRVHLLDTSAQALAGSRERLDSSLAEGVKREKLTPEQADEVRARICFEATDEALAEADWVIEAVFEDGAVKATVLARASGLAPRAAPIATNTSTLRIGDLARHCERPERFLGMHFFNPPPAMKLVEIVPGGQTAPDVTEAALALCERMGKTPIVAPDIPGFLVNRAFAALVAAAIDEWAEGGSPEAIDGAIELALGHKMGPLKTADLVGLDVMLAILRSLHEQTGHARFQPRAEFVALVESGALGRKSGRGFYTYEAWA
jgi:3-hydroxybutyryl-CoA dehydrogenase